MTAVAEQTKPCRTKREPEQVKPEIPATDLSVFLASVLTNEVAKDLMKVDQLYLWGEEKQRFRVNVWTQRWVAGSICPRNNIARSFFLEYDTEKEELSDKTKIRKASEEVVNFFA